MNMRAEIFEKNYEAYCKRLVLIDFKAVSGIIGAQLYDDRLSIPYFDTDMIVSNEGIYDGKGRRADYATCVILAQYILLAPDVICHDGEWVAFRDFREISHITNVNFFHSYTELPIVRCFAEKPEALLDRGIQLGGGVHDRYSSYDVALVFRALPRVSLLLLFNDRDEDFPAECTVLFQKHSEHYLDPESLGMTSAMLAKKLTG